MTVCPWCKARNPSGTQACLRCGKRAADHPSIAGHNVGDSFDDEEAAPGPSLDIDLGTAQRGGFGPTSQPMGRTVGDDDWDEGPAQAGPGLDLDLQADEPARGLGRPLAGDGPPSARMQQAPSARIAIPKGAPKRAGEAGEAAAAPSAATDVDAFEVKALADYGPDPKSIVDAVPYAIRVVRRQRELKRAMAAVRVALAEAEARRDEKLVELGELLRPVVTGNPDYVDFARTLAAAEETKQAREQALASTSAAYRERAASIDAEIATFDGPLGAARRDVDDKARAFEQADLLRKKHEARRKRVEIDVRAAQTKLAAPETSPAERAQAQALIGAAAQERETRAAEERIAIQSAQQAEAALAQARRALADVEGKVEGLRGRRRELEKEFSRQGAVRSEGVTAASKEVRAGLLELGRRALRGGPEAAGADLRRRAVADADAHVKRLQVDLEKHVRAIASADRTAVRNGLVIAGASIAILLVAFIAWRALRSNPYLPPEHQPKSAIVAPFFAG